LYLQFEDIWGQRESISEIEDLKEGVAMDSQKEEVAALYDRLAPVLGSIGPGSLQLGHRLVEIMNIPAGAQVLDVATGQGVNLVVAAEKVGLRGNVVGIDLSKMMVQEAKKDIERRGLQNATILHMDAEHLLFNDAMFDAVLCGLAINLFPHLDQALSEFFRVLRPGGKLGLTLAQDEDQTSKDYKEILSRYHRIYHFPLSPIDGHRLDFSELPQILSRARFDNIQITTERHEFIYADEQEWWSSRWTRGIRYPLEKMSPGVLDTFKTEVFAMLEAHKQPDGIREQLCMWYIVGEKPCET
jgi:ubiquinone/menaquinone biosynthesis C-methylase UbiE